MSLYSCCVEHKCHRYCLDLILGTCVVKPDYHRENDGLGISHSVTHRCSFEKAHVHRIRRARKKGRTEQGGWGGGGWDDIQEVLSERGERSRDTGRADRKRRIKTT